MSIARQQLGRSAERLAASRLAAAGFSILGRNVHIRMAEVVGEIDLIALEGDALVFVEVKAARTGSSLGPERPVLAVGPRKRLRLRRLARAWLAQDERRPAFSVLRFDVIGVRVNADGQATAFEHLRGAF